MKTSLENATDPARFDLAESSAAFALAMSHEPRPPSAGIAGPLAVAAFAVLFILIAATAGPWDGAPPGFALFFFAVPIAMFAMAISRARNGLRFRAAPIIREVLVVVDERVEVSGGGENSSANTTYYATLQSRDGVRVEYVTYGWLAGRIAPTDIGVAFVKAGFLVDFIALRV